MKNIAETSHVELSLKIKHKLGWTNIGCQYFRCFLPKLGKKFERFPINIQNTPQIETGGTSMLN